VFSPDSLPGYTRYRAADHLTMVDDRGAAAVLAWTRTGGPLLWRASAGWLGTRTVTSLDGREDESYLAPERYPEFGLPDSPKSEPFFVYRGEEPYFRRATSQRWTLRADVQRPGQSGNLIKAGGGFTYEHAELRELDLTVRALRLDSLRTYRVWAPGGYAYAHGRWAFEGLVANGGLRLDYFDAGPQADEQAFPTSAGSWWVLSPRLGIAYPISVRDVFSLSYVRVSQYPDRDFLYDQRDLTINRQPIGRPDLEPATEISYQAAVKHLFDEQWSLQAAVFYRDLFGLVGARNIQPAFDVSQLHYRSEEDAHAAGVEMSLRYASTRGHAELHYTYLEARGTVSSEEGVPFGPQLGRRPESIGQHALDWDRRHSIALLFDREWPGVGSLSWTTQIGSGLPWTPRERRTLETDLSQENTRRFKWDEHTAVAVRGFVPWTEERLTLGVEVLNLFDYRSEVAVTTDGYPHPVINTLYDDYGAFRTESGRGGGAYWNDLDGDGLPGWRPVHDARLYAPPRSFRMTLNVRW
jgi:hypothetical protein